MKDASSYVPLSPLQLYLPIKNLIWLYVTKIDIKSYIQMASFGIRFLNSIYHNIMGRSVILKLGLISDVQTPIFMKSCILLTETRV